MPAASSATRSCLSSDVEAPIERLLIEVQRAGDVGNREPILESKPENHAILVAERLHGTGQGIQNPTRRSLALRGKQPIVHGVRTVGQRLERVVAHHRPASPDRQPDEEGGQIRIGGTYAFVGPKVLARLFESQTITTHQPFQLDRNGARDAVPPPTASTSPTRGSGNRDRSAE